MKKSLNLEEQESLLTTRGLIICKSPKSFLLNNNYYRFSGYFRKFQIDPSNSNNNFEDGTNIDSIIDILNIDERLRLALLKCTSIIEQSFRARFAYFFSQKYDPKDYLKRDVYIDKYATDDIDRIKQEIKKSKNIYIKHFPDGLVPIWAVVEILPFGLLSKIIKDSNDDELKKDFVQSYSKRFDEVFFVSSIQSIVALRNMCAHHSRLWNSQNKIKVKLPKFISSKYKKYSENSLFKTIVYVLEIVNLIKQNTILSKKVLLLIDSNKIFSEGIRNPDDYK